ncbi:MAG: 3-oxoacyl-[acyl-carrier-protein] synthase-3 [Limisphaerales bacterium]|jgi:3-oxoacyl-[acyl-carrier-protein] synthase-3
MERPKAAITAVNGWVPEFRLTNFDLEQMVDTNDEWIRTRTGISERRILRDKGKATSDMGAEAVKGLLEKANVGPEEIDLLICTTVTPDMPFPATANIICEKVGIRNVGSFDLNAACSGFVYAVSVASRMIESGAFKKIIVVGADKMSSIVNYQDRTTCVLFGDAAGAILLEPNYEGLGFQDSILKSDGAGREILRQEAGGSLNPASIETVMANQHYITQEGPRVFKFAVKKMADVAEELMAKHNLKGEDISWLVPHQANKRIIDATSSRINLPKDRVMINIQKYGNTTGATIPLCLWEWEKKLHKGDNLILAAFGGGFTWGSAWIKWAYDS